MDGLVKQLETILPGTECRECGFDSCRSYAKAISSGDVGVNLCPPGGEPGRVRLASAIEKPLDDINPVHEGRLSLVVVIEEADCIGCGKCTKICPTDAIVGCRGKMHTVVEQWCCGCDLCKPVCPTDCIKTVPLTSEKHKISKSDLKDRVRHRKERISRAPDEVENSTLLLVNVAEYSREQLKEEIESAVSRRRDC